MNAALRNLLITVAVVLIVLLVYDNHRRTELRIARQEAETLKERADELAKQARVQTEAIKEQTEALRRQSDALNQHATELQAQASAMKDEVAAEHAASDLAQLRSLLRTHRMEGLSAAQSVKVAIAEKYMSSGKMPGSNREAGIAAPDQFAGQSLRSLKVERDGSITLLYNEKAGADGATIKLSPSVNTQTMMISWQCVSDYQDIAQTVPQCEYRPAQAAIANP
jgi:hypothetical protein